MQFYYRANDLAPFRPFLGLELLYNGIFIISLQVLFLFYVYFEGIFKTVYTCTIVLYGSVQLCKLLDWLVGYDVRPCGNLIGQNEDIHASLQTGQAFSIDYTQMPNIKWLWTQGWIFHRIPEDCLLEKFPRFDASGKSFSILLSAGNTSQLGNASKVGNASQLGNTSQLGNASQLVNTFQKGNALPVGKPSQKYVKFHVPFLGSFFFI